MNTIEESEENKFVCFYFLFFRPELLTDPIKQELPSRQPCDPGKCQYCHVCSWYISFICNITVPTVPQCLVPCAVYLIFYYIHNGLCFLKRFISHACVSKYPFWCRESNACNKQNSKKLSLSMTDGNFSQVPTLKTMWQKTPDQPLRGQHSLVRYPGNTIQTFSYFFF